MGMAGIWTTMITISVVCAVMLGRETQVARAALDGAQGALELVFSIGGMLCLWSGVMEIMRRSGLVEKLAAGMGPVLCRIFPQAARDRETRGCIAANISANLLGLGNAATPLGLKAIARMEQNGGRAGDDMCTLVVCNAASLQLIPTTVAAVRAAQGCDTPFDILPAVWITSAVALCTGLVLCRIFRRVWRRLE